MDPIFLVAIGLMMVVSIVMVMTKTSFIQLLEGSLDPDLRENLVSLWVGGGIASVFVWVMVAPFQIRSSVTATSYIPCVPLYDLANVVDGPYIVYDVTAGPRSRDARIQSLTISNDQVLSLVNGGGQIVCRIDRLSQWGMDGHTAQLFAKPSDGPMYPISLSQFRNCAPPKQP